MLLGDIIVTLIVLALISIVGYIKSRDVKGKPTKLGLLAVSLSIASGYLSPVLLLGFPAEVYFNGSVIIWFCAMYLISFPLVAYLFLPILYDQKYSNVYQYLNERFCFASESISSFVFMVMTILYSSVALYAPALALSSSFQIPIGVTIISTAVLATVNINLGGLKTGMINSAIQVILIITTLVVIIALSLNTYGLLDIVKLIEKSNRLDILDFRADPRIRHSVFAIVCGGTFRMLSMFACNQQSIQYYQALGSLKKAQLSIILNIPINIFITLVYIAIGLIIFSVYEMSCHPLLNVHDQIFPLFMIQKMSNTFGLIGVFVAAIYSAGISSLTGSIFSVSEIVYDNFFNLTNETLMYKKLFETSKQNTLKYIQSCIAIVAIILAFVLHNSSTTLLQISLTLHGAAGGMILGIFCVGIFCPWIKSAKSAVVSQLLCIVLTSGIVYCKFMYKDDIETLNINNYCFSSNVTTIQKVQYSQEMTHQPIEFINYLSKISYQYYPLIALLVTFIVANATELCVVLINAKKKETV